MFAETRIGALGLFIVYNVVVGVVLGVLLGFLELVSPYGLSFPSSLLPETVSLRPEPVRSVSKSS